MLAEKLTILVGTMTGTAEMVAEEMSDALAEAGLRRDWDAGEHDWTSA